MTPDRALLLWMDTACCQTHAHPLHKLAQFSITKVYETQSSVVSPHPLLQQDVESDWNVKSRPRHPQDPTPLLSLTPRSTSTQHAQPLALLPDCLTRAYADARQ